MKTIKTYYLLGIFFICAVAILFAIVIVRNGIQPCGWLDNTFLQDTSCLMRLERAFSSLDVLLISRREAIVTSSFSGEVQLWRVANGELIQSLGNYKGTARIAISPDETILAITSRSTVQLRRVDDGQLLDVLNGQTRYMDTVTFSPDGTLLAVAGWEDVLDSQGVKRDYKVQLWRVDDGKLLHTLRGHTGFVKDIAFAPNGALASAGREILIWNVSTGTLLNTLENDDTEIASIAFAPDGTVLASATNEAVKIWQVNNGTLLYTLRGHIGMVNGVAFSPDGTLLASGGGDSTVRLWQAKDGKLINTLKLGHANRDRIYTILFSPEGNLLLTGQIYNPVRVFDVREMVKQAYP